jgi:hypothetical protein
MTSNPTYSISHIFRTRNAILHCHGERPCLLDCFTHLKKETMKTFGCWHRDDDTPRQIGTRDHDHETARARIVAARQTQSVANVRRREIKLVQLYFKVTAGDMTVIVRASTGTSVRLLLLSAAPRAHPEDDDSFDR